ALYRETRTLLGTVGAEGRDHQVAATRDGASRDVDVGPPVRGVGQEVEHSPVVPEAEGAGRRPRQHVLDDPVDGLRARYAVQARLRAVEGPVRDVEDRQPVVATSEEGIHQG